MRQTFSPIHTTLFALMLSPMIAVAQTATDGFVAEPGEPQSWMKAMLFALVALAGICVVGFKNSGRTHLD